MKQFVCIIAILACAAPLAAQSRAGIIVDVEGVHRQGINEVSGDVSYRPEFDNGGGLGVGLNWHLSDRFSIEGKVAALVSEGHLRTVGPDFILNLKLGKTEIYPVTLVAQWHPMEGTALRPYLGIGLAHVILGNIDEDSGNPPIEFDDPTGIVVNAGLRVPISNKWSLNADARYIPVESQGSIRILGLNPARADIDVRPLVIGFGVVYHY
jgi:outer membrane protein W